MSHRYERLSLIIMNKKKIVVSLLLAGLLAGCSAEASTFTQAQKDEIGKIASDYIIKHPEVLIQASNALRDQSMQQQEQVYVKAALANQKALLEDPTTPIVGPKDAKVNVIEFFDYQCAFCSKMAAVIDQTEQANPDVKFIFKETPIFGERWEASKYGAEMGMWVYANYGSKVYKAYHNGVYATGKDEGQLTNAIVNQVATKAGVDVSKFKPDDQYLPDFKLFAALGFQGTPALIVMPSEGANATNTFVIPGYDPSMLKNAIEKVKASVQ